MIVPALTTWHLKPHDLSVSYTFDHFWSSELFVVFADSLCGGDHSSGRRTEGEAGCVVAAQQGGLLRVPE